MNVPQNRNWSAWINTMPGAEHKLIVVGEVETSSGNMVPVLKRINPQGINPSILMLDLTIEDNGSVGIQAVDFREARYEEPASSGDFSHVTIMWKGETLTTMEVTEAT